MRGLTLALLAAAADAAKWPLGAPHADSVPATRTLATRQSSGRCRDAACARVRHIYRHRASHSLKYGL